MSRKSRRSTSWPAEHVEMRAVARLIPFARNARIHSSAQIDQIAASIREWGWTNPVLVDETGMIIAGHGRVLAAKKLGIAEVPVMVARGWTEAQKRAYVLADNQLALNADWDMNIRAAEIEDLRSTAFDIDLIGLPASAMKGSQMSEKRRFNRYDVLIECEDERRQRELLERFEVEGLRCRALIS